MYQRKMKFRLFLPAWKQLMFNKRRKILTFTEILLNINNLNRTDIHGLNISWNIITNCLQDYEHFLSMQFLWWRFLPFSAPSIYFLIEMYCEIKMPQTQDIEITPNIAIEIFKGKNWMHFCRNEDLYMDI